MVCKLAKVLLLASVLGGLCSCASLNTTAARVMRMPAPVSAAAPQTAAPGQPAQGNAAVPPVTTSSVPMPSAAPLPSFPPLLAQPSMPVRIALLLPLRSEALGQAAGVVRAGFLAGYEREKDERLSIDVLETGDAAQDVLSGYGNAVLNHDIVVGPLSRTGVTVIAQSGAVSKPTIALTQADTLGDAEIMLPKQMLVMGLSIEEEARQVAGWAHADNPVGKAFVISTPIAWQRRAAKAFSAQWRRLGAQSESMELGVINGYLSPNGLVQLIKRIQAEQPGMVFAALDAAQASQMREAIGHDIALYGTSQLNPVALPDWNTVDRMPGMDGVRLVDMPWQLQPDHPAVMVYPRLVGNPSQRRNADLERLYALGIDAYRVAREIAANRTQFAIDGVTGKLTVDLGSDASRFERIEVPAIYQDGMVMPVAVAQ